MRALPALVAAVLLTTACSGGEPTAAPNSSISASPTTTTTATPTALLPLWEKRLPAVSPRGACPAEATFEPGCLRAILDFQKLVEEIGDQADALGGRYATVEKAAAEVSEAIEKWVKVCVTSAPNTSERIGCVIGTLSKVKLGDETILAAMYEVERP